MQTCTEYGNWRGDTFIVGYYYSGFLAIQNAVDLSLIVEVNNSFDPTTTVTTQLKRYPLPPYNVDILTWAIKVADKFILVIKFMLPLFILFGFSSVAPTICLEIVLEKENKIKVQSLAYNVTYSHSFFTISVTGMHF